MINYVTSTISMEYFKSGDTIHKIKYIGGTEEIEYSEVYRIIAVKCRKINQNKIIVKALLDDHTEFILIENNKIYAEKVSAGCCTCM